MISGNSIDKAQNLQDHAGDKSHFLQGAAMQSTHPQSFHSELTDERLRAIAAKLLDIRFATIREMNSPFDDNYTREGAVFGRSRNMLIDVWKRREFPWFSIKNAGMDVTFYIGNIPCRFFRDDIDSPEKAGFFKRNAVDRLFEDDETLPVMWRFVIERAMTEDDEDRVFFVGYNVYHEKVSVWLYEAFAPALHSVDQVMPEAAEMAPAQIDIRENGDVDEQPNAASDADDEQTKGNLDTDTGTDGSGKK